MCIELCVMCIQIRFYNFSSDKDVSCVHAIVCIQIRFYNFSSDKGVSCVHAIVTFI